MNTSSSLHDLGSHRILMCLMINHDYVIYSFSIRLLLILRMTASYLILRHMILVSLSSWCHIHSAINLVEHTFCRYHQGFFPANAICRSIVRISLTNSRTVVPCLIFRFNRQFRRAWIDDVHFDLLASTKIFHTLGGFLSAAIIGMYSDSMMHITANPSTLLAFVSSPNDVPAALDDCELTSFSPGCVHKSLVCNNASFYVAHTK